MPNAKGRSLLPFLLSQHRVGLLTDGGSLGGAELAFLHHLRGARLCIRCVSFVRDGVGPVLAGELRCRNLLPSSCRELCHIPSYTFLKSMRQVTIDPATAGMMIGT